MMNLSVNFNELYIQEKFMNVYLFFNDYEQMELL